MVTKGKVGVGWLDGRRKRFVDEVPVAAGAEVSVELLATAPFDLGPLMVRNWSSAEASTVTILGIECFAIAAGEDDSDVARTPPLSEPQVVSHWSGYDGTHGRGLRERARVRRFESLTEPLTLTWSDRLSMRILPRDQLSRAVYVSRTLRAKHSLCAEVIAALGRCLCGCGRQRGSHRPGSVSMGRSRGTRVCLRTQRTRIRSFVRQHRTKSGAKRHADPRSPVIVSRPRATPCCRGDVGRTEHAR